jgi:hypothetical protein
MQIETRMRGMAVNRAERMRWRSMFIEGKAGRYQNAAVLTELSTEAHTIRDVG